MNYFVALLFFYLAYLTSSNDMIVTIVCVMFGMAFLLNKKGNTMSAKNVTSKPVVKNATKKELVVDLKENKFIKTLK